MRPKNDLTDPESLRLLRLAEAGDAVAVASLGRLLGGLLPPPHLVAQYAGLTAFDPPAWVPDNWAAAGWNCGIVADFEQSLCAHIPELRPHGADAFLGCWHLFGRPCLTLTLANRSDPAAVPPCHRGGGLRHLRNIVGGLELDSGLASDRLWLGVLVPRAADLTRAHALGGVPFDPYRDAPLAGILAALDEVWDAAVATRISQAMGSERRRSGGPTAALTDRAVRDVAAGLEFHPDALDAAAHAALQDRLTELPVRRPLAGVLPQRLAALLTRGLHNPRPGAAAAGADWGPDCTDSGGVQPPTLRLVRHLATVLGRSCMTQWGSVRLTNAAEFAVDPDDPAGPAAGGRPVRDCLVVETALDAGDLDVGLRALVAAVNKTGGWGGGGCTSVSTGPDSASWGDGRRRGWLIPLGRDA